MISITEIATNINSTSNQHISFIEKRIDNVANFYIDVFKFLQKIEKSPRISKKSIIESILTIKNANNLEDYKSLLNLLIKTGKKIHKADDVTMLRYPNRRVPLSNNFKVIIKALQNLKKHQRTLLEINFVSNYQAKFVEYDNIRKELQHINFLVSSIIDYEGWFLNLGPNAPWGPYQLTQALDINTCPYCNRIYTYTVSGSGGKKIARPQIDHFLPKSIHPLLALSFYNLIPSCSICNSSLKGQTNMDYQNNVSPYDINSKHSLVRFTYYPLSYEAAIGVKPELRIEAKYNGPKNNTDLKRKVEANIKLFCINDLYKNHNDIVQEIIRKRSISGDKYLESLQNTFPQLKINLNDAYRIAYGNYYSEKEFHKRPLSKLTKDIAVELKALKSFP